MNDYSCDSHSLSLSLCSSYLSIGGRDISLFNAITLAANSGSYLQNHIAYTCLSVCVERERERVNQQRTLYDK